MCVIIERMIKKITPYLLILIFGGGAFYFYKVYKSKPVEDLSQVDSFKKIVAMGSDKSNIPTLLEYVFDKKVVNRKAAALALQEFNTLETIGALEVLSTDDFKSVSIPAIDALGKKSHPRRESALKKLWLHGPTDDEVRVGVASSLLRITKDEGLRSRVYSFLEQYSKSGEDEVLRNKARAAILGAENRISQ